MRTNWHFRNESLIEFSQEQVFSPKSWWQRPKGQPNLCSFFSGLAKEAFKIPAEICRYSNTSGEEWEAIRSLPGDRKVVIKKPDKGSKI